MKRHFHNELKELRQDLLKMGLMVEDNIRLAVEAILELDSKKAESVKTQEEAINQMELDIDDKGHSLLGLEQPVAVDLRRIMMILKINPDLERMGDHAVNIAKRANRILASGFVPKSVLPLAQMAEASRAMVKSALDAFVNEDVDLARTVLKSDDRVDQYDHEIYSQMKDIMESDSHSVAYGIDVAMVGYNLERIGDLASNIAEDVIYIKQGKEVRHHHEVE